MDNDELINSFLDEFKKLENILSKFNSKEITPGNIIPIYHQVLNVNSLFEILKQNNLSPIDAEKVNSATILINIKFNQDIHPLILSSFDKSIQNLMHELKINKTKQKTRESIEQNARNYEKLRELMSTKEFVEQYDKGKI